MRPSIASRRPAALPLLLLLPGLLAAAAPAAAQTPAAPAPARQAPRAAAPGSGDKAEVRAVESRRFAAMVRNDLTELAPLLADDLTYVHSSGKPQTKAELLADLRSGALRYESIQPSGLKIRQFGDVAVVNGQVSVRVQTAGRPLQAVLIYTDVYVRRDGRWQLAAWQSTRATEPVVAPAQPPRTDAPPDRR